MAKEKLTLNEIKVQSIVTALNGEQMTDLKGGANTIRGRQHTYTTRWTAIDTRVEPDAATLAKSFNGG